ncbi:DUF4384 domain-containing protein [Marivita sp. XM-24bin2]|mgnify:CR=1 FL=1|jgi:hypothetical protein|uniref:DUF4384 domain-containing protein n=1 Tax=unclassified Marivita TaxID=2632480 RepID=UPI000D7B01C9|nr:DUF4384 domain-containing protein [Marivita sp. XM-24bin2]MCR9108579.1 DUF4384 domain-containing protein [Paracoccaceae bacterium]PWL36124.1 MAG: hypothetical protein DCO97_05810 [Marivita sp. XM-24bin2]
MSKSAIIWALALAASVSAHVAGAYILYLSTRPGDIPEQPVPETQIELAAYQVQRSTARETAPDADQALSGDTSGASLGQGQIAVSRATTMAPTGTQSIAITPTIEALVTDAPTSPRAAAVSADPSSAQALSVPQDTAALAQPIMQGLDEATISPQAISEAAIVAEATPAQATIPASVQTSALVGQVTTSRPIDVTQSSAPLTAAEPVAFRPNAAVPVIDPAAPVATSAVSVAEAKPTVIPVAQQSVVLEPTGPVAPETDRAKASLAFQGSGDGAIDPVSLSAFQSFMEPGDLSGAAAEVRDGITGVLSAVPCSRLQVEFDPADNTLVVAGHVPEPELRSSVVAAMQAQMGADIPVRDNLLILPRPQCGALAGIASVGLPQSTDQITNPLLVGESTHAREFRYTEGSPLVMALQGADYDAFVYVDYFDANGNVLHLMPNQFTPLTLTPAEGALQIGSETVLEAGEPGLYIEIGPPFGQEIAVAFASSVPLYEGFRPLVEPAEPYLDWLRDRVSDARASDPDFKGEWVYFFVTTAAE